VKDEKGVRVEPTLPLKAEGFFQIEKNAIVIEVELLPPTEMQFEMLAALLDEKDKPKIVVEYSDINNILRLSLTVSHTRDLAKDGHAALKIRHEARNRSISVEDLLAEKNAKTAEIVKRAKGKHAKKAGKRKPAKKVKPAPAAKPAKE
jgi:hypothetical protein